MPITISIPADGTDPWGTQLRTALQTLADKSVDQTIIAAKGNLLAGTANDLLAVVTVGTNGQVLTADSTVATGVKWASVGAGSAAWGGVTGTLSDQLDLQAALDAKISGFADPNADRILFWDDSASAWVALSVTAPLAITGTALAVAAASETVVGVQEFATAAETITGTSNALSVHPAGVTAIRGLYVGINAQIGTTYAPVLTDQGKLVTITNAAAITVTLPANATLAFPVGTQIDFVNLGAGLITFVAGAGATAVATPSLVLRATNSSASAIKIGTNAWLVVGDLA